MNLRTLSLSAASGLLLASSFPTINLHFLAWFALVPLFIALRGQSVKTAFWLGLITGIVYFAGTVYWITDSIHYYGGIPVILASLITLLLCAYLASYPALFAAASAHIMDNRPALLFLAAPALWTALELARTYILSGFPWSLLGYTQYRILPVIQVSDITGVYGVSFLVVLVNASLAGFIMNRKHYATIITPFAAMALILAYGYSRLQATDGGEGIKIAVIQGNIEQNKKWDPAYQAGVSAIYSRLTLEAVGQHPDLIVWPETATPFNFNGIFGNDQRLSDNLVAFVKQIGVPFLFGSPTTRVLPSHRIISRNSAILLSADGRVDAEYSKMHLVPFGEYVPLRHLLFFVGSLTHAIGETETGRDYTVMTVPYGDKARRKEAKICTVICYEIIFPDLVRKFVAEGAGIVTTITNDAWFGKTAAPFQHFSMAVFRAVENRVPVARSANTGISGFIDARGQILDTSRIFTETYLTSRLAPGTGRTFYTRHGDLFSYVCVFFSLVVLAAVAKHPAAK